MFGWSSRTRGPGLGLETRLVRRRREVAAQDHLQRDNAIQRSLPGLVDDPHAAPADLFQQIVIAEPMRQRRSLCGWWTKGTGRWDGEPGPREGIDELCRRPELPKLGRQIGMLLGDRLDIRLTTLPSLIAQLREEAGEAFVALGCGDGHSDDSEATRIQG